MAVRLLVVAHGPTTATAGAVFGDSAALASEEEIPAVDGRVQEWVCGPEPACVQTATALGSVPRVEPALAAPTFGTWSGQALATVAAANPLALQSWLSDPRSAPHGGESLNEALIRIAAVLDQTAWPAGRSVVVVSPLAARLVAAHAVGAPAELVFRLDVPPGGRFAVSGGGGSWRLRIG